MYTIVQRQDCHCGFCRDQRHFQFGGREISMETVHLVRYQGKWKTIRVKPFEPERMTADIAWLQIKEGLTPHQAYVRWFEQQRKLSRLLQQ